ncbi:MAG: hypothetical protein RIR48_2294 [Bacteroidota bacterium]
MSIRNLFVIVVMVVGVIFLRLLAAIYFNKTWATNCNIILYLISIFVWSYCCFMQLKKS